MVFATTLLLIGLVVTLNAAAILLRERLRRKYATSAF
jgi:phosphate transport system permease protein